MRMTEFVPEKNHYKLVPNVGIMETIQQLGKLEDENIILRHRLHTAEKILQKAKNFDMEKEK